MPHQLIITGTPGLVTNDLLALSEKLDWLQAPRDVGRQIPPHSKGLSDIRIFCAKNGGDCF